MVGFRGSTQEKRPSEIFRFGYRKASDDKMVRDPVGSGIRQRSPSHDVNGKNAALMTCEQVIDKIAND
jgi:hypothetical protein